MDESSEPLLSLDSEAADDDVETNDRSLSANKDYHVFISYSSEDKEFVKALHRHLEENVKFRCMIAERDFTIGAPVMDNISEAMDRSEKALFVVSTNFLNSEFCKREVDFAHIFAIDNKHLNYAIILKIDDCKLDRKMRICTYIDGSDRDIEAIGHKLEMAYSAGHESIDLVGGNRNGKVILRKYPVAMSSDLCGGMEYVFPDLSEDDMEKLRGAHIEDSATHYNSIKTEINKKHLLRRYVLISTSTTRKATCVYAGVSMACLTFIFSVMFFMHWGNESLRVTTFWIVGSTLAISISLGVSFGLVITWKMQAKSKILTGLKAVALNKMKLKNSKFIVLPKFRTTYFLYTEDLYIVFVYYDISPCWNHFKEHVEWSDNSTKYINERCDQLFKELIIEIYFYNKDIPITNTPRHPTVRSQQCFCENLEDNHGNKYEQLEKETEQNESEDTCQVEVLGSEETCRMEVVGSEETCLMKVVGSEETCRMEVERSDETCVMEAVRNHETCRVDVVRKGLSENT